MLPGRASQKADGGDAAAQGGDDLAGDLGNLDLDDEFSKKKKKKKKKAEEGGESLCGRPAVRLPLFPRVFFLLCFCLCFHAAGCLEV